ncbi:MAG: LD-carboxypeptidase [Spirochaetales bacterium]|nr:LD-carboxypeptidase [Spirochaetales bacterium]
MKHRIAIVGCSDPLFGERGESTRKVIGLLRREGHEVFPSDYLYQPFTKDLPRLKARELNSFFRDPEMGFIFDVSGGDLANTVLPYLDYEAIRKSSATFHGYSDLSTVLNAIVAKTGRQAVNYQIRNLVYDHAEEQLAYFKAHILEHRVSLSDLDVHYLRGSSMEGRVLGGNTRCFQKLAGTEYWPCLDDSIILLESYGGVQYRMMTALEQYIQMGVFQKVSGVLLGTFTKMDRDGSRPTMREMVLENIPEDIPVAETRFIGHNTDARAIVLG